MGYERRYRCDNYTVWTFVEEGGGPSGGGTGSSGGGGNPGGSPTPPNCGTVPVDPLIAGRVVDPCDEGPGWIPVPIDEDPPIAPVVLTSVDMTEINDPCLQNIINHIGASGHTTFILRTYFDQNFNSPGAQKKYTIKYLTNTNLVGSNGQPVPGQTHVNTLPDGTNEVQITLNPGFFQNTTKEWVTSVILHELLHGIILVEQPNLGTNDLQHSYMFDYGGPNTISKSLIELFPGIDPHNAIALGMQGMSSAYTIQGTNTIDPVKDIFAQQHYFQSIAQATVTFLNYQNAISGFGIPFC